MNVSYTCILQGPKLIQCRLLTRINNVGSVMIYITVYKSLFMFSYILQNKDQRERKEANNIITLIIILRR